MISLPKNGEAAKRPWRHPAPKRPEHIPTYRITSAVEAIHLAAGVYATDYPPQRSRAAGMREAARKLEDIIGIPDAAPPVFRERLELACAAVNALCVELERAGYSQDEIKLALDGARQERMR